jgi:hypothetical protein
MRYVSGAVRRVAKVAARARRGVRHAVDGLAQRAVQRTPLMDAAARGDTAAVERLLADGASPDVRDQRGQTALHHAVRQRHAETAACLLVHRADPRIADRRGGAPLSLAYTTMSVLHAVRQRYRRYRLPAGGLSETARRWSEQLDQRGIVKLEGFLSPRELDQLVGDHAAFVRNLEAKLARGEGTYRHYDEEENWMSQESAFVTNNAFKYSPELARICCRR